MKKREYIPANIRAGFNVKDCLKTFNNIYANDYGAPFKVCIDSFNHGHDINGNGTAHYTCHIVATHKTIKDKQILFCRIVESGKKREQVGYSGKNEAALYALNKLGFNVDTSSKGSYDSHGEAYYPLLNFPPMEC